MHVLAVCLRLWVGIVWQTTKSTNARVWLSKSRHPNKQARNNYTFL